jgi:stearoyl-CoA desaturase (delta-9 desaturase)
MAVILTFFVGHWLSSVFCQTFFQHRYGAHRQFTMSKGWERFFHLFTYIAQGSSFLSPRAYAILHRMHHAFSDTERDPHLPLHSSNPATMMWKTKRKYDDYAYRRDEPDARFDGGFPEWPWLDKLSQSWTMRLAWGAAYTGVYVAFAPSYWWFLLLPAHYVMGPIHGAIVNWGGHKYGYRNYKTDDVSRNTLIFDFLTLGELLKNNPSSRFAASGLSLPWMRLKLLLTPKSPRIVPGSALLPNVAPIILREISIALRPRTASTSTGLLVMKPTRPL